MRLTAEQQQKKIAKAYAARKFVDRNYWKHLDAANKIANKGRQSHKRIRMKVKIARRARGEGLLPSW
jgi:hypothetical protein